MYISELASRCRGPTFSCDLSSTPHPPSRSFYTSGAPQRPFLSRPTRHRFNPQANPHPAAHPSIPQRRSRMRYQGPPRSPLSPSGIITLNLCGTEKGNCNDLQGGTGGGGTGCDGVAGWKRLGTSGEEGSRWLLWDADGISGGGGEGYREHA